jgi:hypothetical protein
VVQEPVPVAVEEAAAVLASQPVAAALEAAVLEVESFCCNPR